jgi:HSP20 family protein
MCQGHICAGTSVKGVSTMVEEKQKVAAQFCSYVDNETNMLEMEISIPGVKKEDIRLRVSAEALQLIAPRDDFEYVTVSAFCCPVKAEAATAKYENGLLKLSIPFKEAMEDALDVTIA